MPVSQAIRPVSVGTATTASDGTQFERIPVMIFDESGKLAYHVARRIAQIIEAKRAVGDTAVLGLPTGSTPIGVYHHLVEMHRNDGLDFSNVVTFNLDEYHPIGRDTLQSYHRFMRENLFDLVNIPEENIHIPDGTLARDEVEAACLAYEHEIQKAGGIDLLILGIGRTGHIGFNEPGSAKETRTRLIVLDEITRKDAASDFFSEEAVPQEAITMGVGTILEAREIILIATGEHKAPIIRRAVEDEPSKQVTASYLQEHPAAEVYLDRSAASRLTREERPWLVMDVEWDDVQAKRAVIWLSEELDKPILHLEASDFYRHHLHTLVHKYESVDDLCSLVFDDLRRRITYASDLPRDESIVLFSPHPDDDVISMGGMLDKLVSNGNRVIVAYMTNGSVAVFDEDAVRHLEFLRMSADVLVPDRADDVASKTNGMIDFIESKPAGEVDTDDVQRVKAYIRYTEAVAGIKVMGLGPENARFLDLPFYKTGRVKKDPIGPDDVKIIRDLLEEMAPSHIFVAGDLSDPHGTHRMCYNAIREALHKYNDSEDVAEGEGPTVWLYRGAWQEWEIDVAHVFLPMSKADLNRKIDAIFKHESQKDRALFPGAYDEREFWQRARDRNTQTAKALDALGLPAFHAAEAFVISYDMA